MRAFKTFSYKQKSEYSFSMTSIDAIKAFDFHAARQQREQQ